MSRPSDPNPRPPEDRRSAARALGAQLETLWRAGISATPEDVCADPKVLAQLREHLAGRGLTGTVETVKSDPHKLLPPTLPPAGPGTGSAPDAPPGFVIEAELGEGTFGVVYRAHQPEHGRTVALKTLRLPDEGARREALRRFHLEARALGAVRHPNVIRIFDSVPHGSRHVLVLEYLPGGTLGGRLADGRPMNPRAAAALVEQVACGVAAIHAAGIVHRDLKPGNILFDDRGRPKVADFGLAKFGDGSLTLSRATVGTPAYMSPEQARGEGKHAGPAADVWSLGVILYECLAGRRPFDSDGVYGVLIRVINGEREPLRAVVPNIPPALERVVDRCLQPDPAARYPTAAEVADALHAFLTPVPAVAPPRPPDAGFGVRAVFLGIAFGFVVALLGAAIFELATDRRVVLVPSKAEAATARELADARQQLTEAKAEPGPAGGASGSVRLAAALNAKAQECEDKERERAGLERQLAELRTAGEAKRRELVSELAKARMEWRMSREAADALAAEQNGLKQASAKLAVERDKFAAALEAERQAREADVKRLADGLKKATDGSAAVAKEREAFNKEREKLEQAAKEKNKEREKLAADLQARAAEVTKLTGEKAAAQKEQDELRKQLGAAGPAAAAPLKLVFAPSKPDSVGLPAPQVEVLAPAGFEPKEDPNRSPSHREYTLRPWTGGAQSASVKVAQNRLVVEGPTEFGLSLVRVRSGDGGPAVYQLFQPEVLVAEKWPPDKPAVVNKDVRFEFPVGKLADAGASPFLKALIAPAKGAEVPLLPVPRAKAAVALNGQKVELQPRADNPLVFESAAGLSPPVRLEVAGGKVLVTVRDGRADADCQVAHLELGRAVKWPDGAVTVQRLVTVLGPPTPPKK